MVALTAGSPRIALDGRTRGTLDVDPPNLLGALRHLAYAARQAQLRGAPGGTKRVHTAEPSCGPRVDSNAEGLHGRRRATWGTREGCHEAARRTRRDDVIVVLRRSRFRGLVSCNRHGGALAAWM